MTHRDVFWKNLETLQERAKNLGYIMRDRTLNTALQESLHVIDDMKYNLTTMEAMIRSLKDWTKPSDPPSEK